MRSIAVLAIASVVALAGCGAEGSHAAAPAVATSTADEPNRAELVSLSHQAVDTRVSAKGYTVADYGPLNVISDLEVVLWADVSESPGQRSRLWFRVGFARGGDEIAVISTKVALQEAGPWQ